MGGEGLPSSPRYVWWKTPYLGLRINASPQQTELLCDRGTDVRSVSGHDIFGRAWTFSIAASAMKRSRLTSDNRERNPEWVLDLASRPTVDLGNPTGRTTQQKQYAKYSVALQSFIDDPA
jgi:hypothetical protein